MSTQPDIRAQIRSLTIPKEQRPAAGKPEQAAKTRSFTWLYVMLAVAAAAFVVYRYVPVEFASSIFSGSSTAASPVTFVTVTERAADEPIPVHTASGKIVSDRKVSVTTKVSGQITELLFEQGDKIVKGQVLARIERVLPKARRDEAAAALQKSMAALEFQKVNFERVKKLHDSENAPDIEFAEAVRALDEAQAQVKQDQATLEYAEKVLRDCEVVAPISGVILERNVEVGDFVAAEGGIGANANAQFGTIADMSVLRVEVDISELDISRISRNMRCRITPDAYKNRRFDGYVMWIDPGANYSKATVQVKVRIENPDDSLRVEGVAQVVFYSDETNSGGSGTGRIWIPSTACASSNDGKSGRVFVLIDGHLKATAVTLGASAPGQVEILSGLAAGQNIAASDVEKLSDGQRIKN
ncbi:MAG: efflux RND transporter periplasmic adaptor subunit [Phycisphaerae bacterium]|nr:efflux RND transporter periplasmic adaptor subunit [Phycisphaerae bacterium]